MLFCWQIHFHLVELLVADRSKPIKLLKYWKSERFCFLWSLLTHPFWHLLSHDKIPCHTAQNQVIKYANRSRIKTKQRRNKNTEKKTLINLRRVHRRGRPPPLSKTVIWLLRQSITSFSTRLTYGLCFVECNAHVGTSPPYEFYWNFFFTLIHICFCLLDSTERPELWWTTTQSITNVALFLSSQIQQVSK